MTLRFLPALAVVAAACAGAQTIEVYSELQRVDPFGQVLAADRAETPREILSPVLARNTHFTFQAVVKVPPGMAHTVFVAQNPENAVRVAAYRPVYVNRGGAWIPDALLPVDVSPDGRVAEIPLQVQGQTARTIWIDLWIAPDAMVRRTRLEVQLFYGGQNWIIYPMELRTHDLVAPDASWPLEPLAPMEASAAESAAAAWRVFACGVAGAAEAEGPFNVRRLIRRNARQDVAFAREVAGKRGKAETLAEFFAAARIDPGRWCKNSAPPPSEWGAEWWLRLRQSVYRRAESSD